MRRTLSALFVGFVVSFAVTAHAWWPTTIQAGGCDAGSVMTGVSYTKPPSCSSNATTSSNTWATAIDCDFTAQATQTLATDGTYTVCGATWTKINSRNEAAAMTVTNGTGLVITPNANSDFFQLVRSSPGLSINMASIIPGFSYDTSVRVLMYIASFNGAANFDAVDIALESSTADAGPADAGKVVDHFYHLIHYGWDGTPSAAPGITYHAYWDGLNGVGNGGTYCTTAYSTSGRNVVGWVNAFGLLPMGVDITELAGAYASGFPTIATIPSMCGLTWSTDVNGSLDESKMQPPGNWDVLVTAVRSNSATAGFAPVVGRVLIQYR